MRTVHVAGDSHTLFCFANPEAVHSTGPVVAPFPASPYVALRTHHLGALTMYRAGRDRGVLDPVIAETHLGDVLVAVFGEIDVRCHVVRLAQRTGRSVEELVVELAAAYVARLTEVSRHGIVVFGVIPPFDPPGYELVDFPIVGELRERVRAARTLNEALAWETLRHGFLYFDVYDELAGPDGSLPLENSDRFCHIGHHMKAVPLGKLQRLLGGS